MHTPRTILLQTLGHFVLGHSAPQDFADFLRQRVEANYFAAAVLDQRQYRGSAADALAELGQGQPPGPPGVSKPLAEYSKIHASVGEGGRILRCENCHIFMLDEILAKFRTSSPSLAWLPAAG